MIKLFENKANMNLAQADFTSDENYSIHHSISINENPKMNGANR